ncbi:MAG: MFS transporter [Rhodospirillaceae bacterium]|nr:MFS transporter [Rhodospirillaceae bacterium]
MPEPTSPPPEAPRLSAGRITATLCAAEILGMLGFSAVPALLPALSLAWSLSATEAGILTGAFFGGYMVSVPVLTALTDRIDARKVYLSATLLAALGNLGLALFARDLGSGIAFQIVSGIGLAGMYMPGLKLLSDHVTGPKQSRFVAFYTSSFGVGASVSYLATGAVAALLDWRYAFGCAAAGALVSAALTLAVPRGAKAPPGGPSLARLLDMRPVLRNREAMTYVLGYAAHNFELFAVRGWVVAFLVFGIAQQPAGATVWAAPAVAGVATFLGVVTSILGNEMAMRVGRRRFVVLVMGITALLAASIGWSAALPYPLIAALVLAHAMLMTLDSASLTAGALAAAAPGQRGATMAVHSTLGFALAFLGALVFGAVLDFVGPATVAGWGAAFGAIALVDAAGALLVWHWGRRTA